MCEERQEREEQVLPKRRKETDRVFGGQGGGWRFFLEFGRTEYILIVQEYIC